MVGAVQQGAHMHEGSRSKRKSGGPVFTLPALTCTDATATAVGVSAPATGAVVPGKFGQTSAPAPGISTGELTKFVGRSTGSGQCVALAKAVQPALGSTAHWRGGEKVQG